MTASRRITSRAVQEQHRPNQAQDAHGVPEVGPARSVKARCSSCQAHTGNLNLMIGTKSAATSCPTLPYGTGASGLRSLERNRRSDLNSKKIVHKQCPDHHDIEEHDANDGLTVEALERATDVLSV